MTRTLLIIAFAAAVSASGAYGFDLPFGVTVKFGLDVSVVPDAKDMSRQLGLGVTTNKVLTEEQQLVITGTITNYSAVPYDCLEMHFAVTSYIGLGTSLGWAVIEPNSIPPRGTSTFKAFISLDSKKPSVARYWISASPSPLCSPGANPAPAAIPAPEQPMETMDSGVGIGEPEEKPTVAE